MTNTAVKNHSTTRELVLRVKPGSKPLNSIGIVDSRLLTGENKLYAYLDPVALLWRVRYKFGIIPEQLKQNWTKFSYLTTYVRNYFEKRNIDLVSIVDVHEDIVHNAAGG